MKKLLAILSITGFMAACNDSSTDTDSTADTASTETTMPADTSAATSASPMKDSVMQFTGGKVMVMVSGSWAALDKPVTTTNGRTVKPNGEVSKGDKKRMMEEGQMIDKDGQMMDKDGKM